MLPDFVQLTNKSLSSFLISEDQIKELLTGLDVNKAHDLDEISASMIKLCDISLVKPLKIISSSFIKTGSVPPQWKKTNICPTHKKTDKQIIDNYRPSLVFLCLLKYSIKSFINTLIIWFLIKSFRKTNLALGPATLLRINFFLF